VPANLVHLSCGHSNPSRYALINIRNDIGMQSIANSVAAYEPPKYRTLLDTSTLQPDPQPLDRLLRKGLDVQSLSKVSFSEFGY
jgi:hypothetical protein